MIHDTFYEDPYPINISGDDLIDCYAHETEDGTETLVRAFSNPIDLTEIAKIWQSMVLKYIESNLSDANFAIFSDGKELVHSKKFKKTLKKYGVDLSHFDGMSKEELLFIAVPFDNIDQMFEFGSKFINEKEVRYFGFGEYLGDNFSS